MSEHSKEGDVYVYQDGDGLCIAITPRDNEGVFHITPTRIHICEDADFTIDHNDFDLKVFTAEELRTVILELCADEITKAREECDE